MVVFIKTAWPERCLKLAPFRLVNSARTSHLAFWELGLFGFEIGLNWV